jgi:methyl-coenzyme M reductase alpha subunit
MAKKLRDIRKMSDRLLEKERESPIYKISKEWYPGEEVDPMDRTDHMMYKRGGLQQSKTKMEFTEWGRKIAVERGIPSYNREVGIPMGQRWLSTGKAPGTDAVIGFDDVQFMSNPAIQQMVDDMKRTIILNLDVPHRTIQLRLGKEISPETMNLFMETLQHRLAGGAVIQEHMSEIHPGLTRDAYAKVFTGDDELADQFDKRWLLDISKEFHPERAEALKVGAGEKLCCAVHESTIRVRSIDGGAIVRSGAQAATMSFVATYRLTGESVLSDIAYSTRHAQQIRMGEIMWPNRARSPNEVGGMTFGYLADMATGEHDCETAAFMELLGRGDTEALLKPMQAMMTSFNMFSTLLESFWLGHAMAGGVGFTSGSLGMLGAFDTFMDADTITSLGGMGGAGGGMLTMTKGHERVPSRWIAIKPFVHMIAHMVMEQFEKYPVMCELAWAGVHRLSGVSLAGAMLGSFMGGSSLLGQVAANYCIGLLAKEGWLRTGWAGQEVQHHIGPAYSGSLRMEEGGLPELKGDNVPYMSYTAVGGSQQGCMASYGAMLGRGSSWTCSPLIKICFVDKDLMFDFRDPTACIAKGALREFEPAGERDIVRPAR